MPYEEDIHVPFFIRGPGIDPNTQVSAMIANIDLAPTIATLTSIKTADFVDGRSFASLLTNGVDKPSEWCTGLLIEIGYGENPFSLEPQNISLPSSIIEYPDSSHDNYLAQTEGGAYRGIRTENFVYAEYDNGELEFYDLTIDPYQLQNTASTLDPTFQAQLHAQLELLKTCTAETCRTLENQLNFEK
jgi:hypothetical protein